MSNYSLSTLKTHKFVQQGDQRMSIRSHTPNSPRPGLSHHPKMKKVLQPSLLGFGLLVPPNFNLV